MRFLEDFRDDRYMYVRETIAFMDKKCLPRIERPKDVNAVLLFWTADSFY